MDTCYRFLPEKGGKILNPEFSIVIPVYNAEKYLKVCVLSVEQQNFTDWEIVLVNDGSQDGSGDLCDGFAQRNPRIRVIHQSNGGSTVARKVGSHEAHGRYLIFLDSDDYLEPGLLTKLHSLANAYSPDVILFQFAEIYENARTEYHSLLPEGGYCGERMCQIKECVLYNKDGELVIQYGVWGKAFLRQKFLQYQDAVPDYLYKGEDLAASAPMIADAECVVVSDFCGYAYRQNPASLMHTFRIEDAQQIAGVAQYLRKCMSPFYQGRIDYYVLTHYFDFLDRAISHTKGYRQFQKLIKETMDQEIIRSLQNAKCLGKKAGECVVYYLLHWHMWWPLWVLRHLKPPRCNSAESKG